MKPYFLTTLQITELPDGEWELVDGLAYHSEILDRIVVVPRGFKTDLASVPRLPFVYMAAGGKANAPAVIHDFLYHTKACDRRTADSVFEEAMAVIGESWWRRKMMWLGVRLFGWIPYDNSGATDEEEHPFSR